MGVATRPAVGIALLSGALGLGATQPADASLVFSLGTVFNGTAPTSTPPWLTATFTTVSPGTVTLELDASLEVASEFIDAVNFNLDPAILPSALSITTDSCITCVVSSITNTTANGQNLTGGGAAGFGFDVNISFDNSPPANRFDGIDVAKFTITDVTDLITESSFNFTNTGSASVPIAAHIQGIPVAGGGTTSGAAGGTLLPSIPEPGTVALLGIGLAGLGFARRKRTQ